MFDGPVLPWPTELQTYIESVLPTGGAGGLLLCRMPYTDAVPRCMNVEWPGLEIFQGRKKQTPPTGGGPVGLVVN